MKIRIGLYGDNGHQIAKLLDNHPSAELAAIAGVDMNKMTPSQRVDTRIRHYSRLDELLKDRSIDLISLCSPRRADQAGEAIVCLNAGKHVYAEKPCAMTESDLDEIIRVSTATGKAFHEMAGTAFAQPYYAMRNLVLSGALGTVVQVFAQKSYPFHPQRPQDEDEDGGLILQNGVHAVRFIEHVACVKVKSIHALETGLGNPVDGGGLVMASSIMMSLENGGVASAVVNYLNPMGFGSWGNEHLRIFGTQGMVETVDGGRQTRFVLGEKDMGPINTNASVKNYLDMYIDSLLDEGDMPLLLDEELHPTRMVIRAKQASARHTSCSKE